MTGWLLIGIAVFQLIVPVSAYADPLKPNTNWEVLYSEEGITVERGSVADSPYMAFRGTGVVEARLGKVISILLDHKRANEWVHNLIRSIELRAMENYSVVVWQRFDNPWPTDDRDLVYLAEPGYDETKKYFRVWFRDIADTEIILTDGERSRIPDQSCCVVAKLAYTEWQFRATSPDSTCVRVEVMLDPKGWIPAMLVNQFQRDWPYMTIQGLRKQAQKEDVKIHEKFGAWSADRPGTRISRAQCEKGRLID